MWRVADLLILRSGRMRVITRPDRQAEPGLTSVVMASASCKYVTCALTWCGAPGEHRRRPIGFRF